MPSKKSWALTTLVYSQKPSDRGGSMNTQKTRFPGGLAKEYALYFIYFFVFKGTREGEVPMTEGGGG